MEGHDLYGNLPPVAGKTTLVPAAAEATAAAAAPVDDLYADFLRGPGAPPTFSAGTKSANQATTSSTSLEGTTTAKPGAKLASSLIFKPRQTSVVASKPPFGLPEKPKPITASQTQPLPAPTPALAPSLAANSVPLSSSSLSGAAIASADSRTRKKKEGAEEEDNDDDEKSMEIAEFNSHSSFEVEDAYDPHKPNDYLAYCSEREERKRLAKLAEDNQKLLDELERQRQDMEKQRKEAADKRDFQKLLEGQQNPAGRGRGRGLLNLPSWITQQMASEVQVPAPMEPSAATQFQDAESGDKRSVSAVTRPSCVLLLLNMATAEEMRTGQADLTEEVREGCEKYGSVLACEVCVLREEQHPHCPANKRVRVFVQFQRQDSAIRALKDLNGRFFGGRQVSASFYDEDSFRQKDWLR